MPKKNSTIAWKAQFAANVLNESMHVRLTTPKRRWWQGEWMEWVVIGLLIVAWAAAYTMLASVAAQHGNTLVPMPIIIMAH